MTTTYAKLRDGNWGLRIQGQVSSNQTVTVRRKDGQTRTETVGRILWHGDGITLATIGGSRPTMTCRNCGRPIYGRGVEAADMSGIVMRVCRQCADGDVMDRSYC